MIEKPHPNFKAFEHFLSLDLKTLTLQKNILNESSWVFVAKWPKSRSQLHDFLRPAFLISTQAFQTAHSIAHVTMCNFNELSLFFTRLYDGAASSDTAQRGFNHLCRIAGLPRELKFEEERKMFCDQFNKNSPGIGLEGFLYKRKNPFSSINQKPEALKILSDWLQKKHHQHPPM